MQVEAKLQARCVLWFSQTYPEKRGALWGNFASQSASQASQKLSLGLVRSLPDLMCVAWGEFFCIELKERGSIHSVRHLREQCEWLMKYPSGGCFCDSLDMFINIIQQEGYGGIPARNIYDRLSLVNTKSVAWNKLVEGL
jgi:hypothetical protein